MCTAPGTLAAPELNTSLALAQEARAVKQQPFNSQHAAHKLLAQSFSTRCALEGRAGAGEAASSPGALQSRPTASHPQP